MPFKSLLDVTGMEYNNLLQLLRQMKKDNMIQSPGKGLYEIPKKHDPHDRT
jgi:hypothetical protein